mmetsp:Transcript_108617/g.233866  ORF Transcript_108617/g.233866 Transcript_108617/m.233866 type:complete len:152 (+) Transcript_108617:205-660(+)|eukprot:CAMPEP_0116927890 /NCGR_PEP_ID=MMETSP0467-20121206/25646_1 /TAXON_ID=283647 /ORGANISM="Mesodinium pulex, Strain SPMC105" /LENGTH=151 /DNA_ID=CAMNT_0004607537 /DNA_START=204 /DNA_END=659 /DNA_ORIENTATION=+
MQGVDVHSDKYKAIVLKAIAINTECIGYASAQVRSDPDVIKLLVRLNSNQLFHIHQDSLQDPELALELLSINPRVYKDLHPHAKNNIEVIRQAISSDLVNILQIPEEYRNDTDLIKNYFVTSKEKSLKYLPDKMQNNLEIVKIAISNNPEN